MKHKKLIRRIIFALLLLAAIFFFIRLYNQPDQENIMDVNLKEHKNIALHIHPLLSIEILGQTFTVPANIGISAKGMRVIHTHDATGKLHIESPYHHQFYLDDFFAIWGKNLNSSCIFDYCGDKEHKLTFYVNGVQNEQKDGMPLKDGDEIKIVYEKINFS